MNITKLPYVSKKFPEDFNESIQSAGKEPLLETGTWLCKGELELTISNNDGLSNSYMFFLYNFISEGEAEDLVRSVLVKFELIKGKENSLDLIFKDYVDVGYNSFALVLFEKFLIVCACLSLVKGEQKPNSEPKIYFVNVDAQSDAMNTVSITPKFLDQPVRSCNAFVKWFTYSDYFCIVKSEYELSRRKWYGTLYYIPIQDIVNATPNSELGFSMIQDSCTVSYKRLHKLDGRLLKLIHIVEKNKETKETGEIE
ncbi:MAG: hypothetical protein LBE12_03285 [Planctomycetaceae bacterium]|jgi:hypothetical protein|nr:hypothetical protein [Planctomycetaceae bacterium]